MISRGIRNNNPLNIRRSKDQWQGMKKTQSDSSFCQFETFEYRLYTIRGIVQRWAPPGENNTEAYIRNVSRLTGISADEPLGIPSEHPARWMLVGAAMAIQENGTEVMDWLAMLRGWEKRKTLTLPPSAGCSPSSMPSRTVL